jgi:23S rRNA (adenine2503-C2)-methyltransferase
MHPIARLPEEWEQSLRVLSERPYRARQIFRWIHSRGVLDPGTMTDIPEPLRSWLLGEGMERVPEVARVHRAADGTRKALVRLADGVSIETVLIPAQSSEADADAAVADEEEAVTDPPAAAVRGARVTQCISTQVGCAMGCAFCASGAAGLKRNLAPDEIVAQVILGRTLIERTEELRNIVLMGIGEPLSNYEATARALRLLTHPLGMALSPRRITVSTVGIIPGIQKLGEQFAGQIGLAVSLHAADDQTRGRLLPINRTYPLAAVIAALRAYPLPKRRRIFIEYTLVAGVNDDLGQASALARLLRGIPVKINLIPMNAIEASGLSGPDMQSVHRFQQVLIDDGYTCFVRRRRGDDLAAACGQLAFGSADSTAPSDRRKIP